MAGGVPALHPERKGQLNRSPKKNWVEARGGLPAYVNSVATALERGGMTRSRAIATAVNTIKQACATGLWGGQKRKISPAIQAAACKAAAQWEALKVSASIPSDADLAVELARRWDNGAEPGAAILELAHEIRSGTVELAFSEADHPRAGTGSATGGQFIKAGSKPGEAKDGAAKKLGCEGGELSAKCIRRYQRRNGLQEDGIIGRQTATALRTGKKVSTGTLDKQDRRYLRSDKKRRSVR